jgi:hypothetical protein
MPLTTCRVRLQTMLTKKDKLVKEVEHFEQAVVQQLESQQLAIEVGARS